MPSYEWFAKRDDWILREPFWTDVFRAHFGALYKRHHVIPNTDDRQQDQADFWIEYTSPLYRKHGMYIEMNMQSIERDEYHFEYVSNDQTGKIGWSLKPHLSTLLAWYFKNRKIVDIVPMREFCAMAQEMTGQWRREHRDYWTTYDQAGKALYRTEYAHVPMDEWKAWNGGRAVTRYRLTDGVWRLEFV